MKKFLVVLCVAVLVFGGAGSIAQAQDDGWSIQLEPMWMDVKGNDIHVGDIFRWKIDWYYDGVKGIYTRKYGVTYEPINLDMDDNLTVRAELTYRKNQWGLGFSGWWFNTDASVSGRVTTPKRIEGTDGVNFWGTYYRNGVRMWDHTIRPVWTELEVSGFSPVDYWAGNDLGVWTIDVHGIRTLAEKKDSHVDLAFGLKFGSLDNKRSEGQSQRAFIYDAFGPGLHFDNQITLQSKSEADYGLMAGPVLGFQGKARYEKFGIEGLVNQSLLIGKVDQSGHWRDTDDMWIVKGPKGGPFTPVRQYAYLDGNFPFSKKETVALPVTEAKLKFLYFIRDNISAGIGGFASIWWNAPVAPKWSIPGDWTALEGTGWRLQEDTLVFYGGMLALNIQF